MRSHFSSHRWMLLVHARKLVDKAGPSYINTQGLLRFIEDIPAQAEWESVVLSFKDAPEDKYMVHYRSPVEAIKTLLRDQSLAKDIVYKPKRIFTNTNKDKRVYNEMWMGTWWEETQVSTDMFRQGLVLICM